MLRTVILAAVLAGVVATRLAVGAGPAPTFPYGVASGEIGTRSAKVWTRAAQAGPVKVYVSTQGDARGGIVASVSARAANDFTVARIVTGLRPGTRYFYAFTVGSVRSAVGRFETAPAPTASARVRFAISGDADAGPAVLTYPPYPSASVPARHR